MRLSLPLEPLDSRAEALPDYDTPEEIALDKCAADEVEFWLSQLQHREADVLLRRYGIGRDEQTLQEVGNAMRFTRERAPLSS